MNLLRLPSLAWGPSTAKFVERRFGKNAVTHLESLLSFLENRTKPVALVKRRHSTFSFSFIHTPARSNTHTHLHLYSLHTHNSRQNNCIEFKYLFIVTQTQSEKVNLVICKDFSKFNKGWTNMFLLQQSKTLLKLQVLTFT